MPLSMLFLIFQGFQYILKRFGTVHEAVQTLKNCILLWLDISGCKGHYWGKNCFFHVLKKLRSSVSPALEGINMINKILHNKPNSDFMISHEVQNRDSLRVQNSSLLLHHRFRQALYICFVLLVRQVTLALKASHKASVKQHKAYIKQP